MRDHPERREVEQNRRHGRTGGRRQPLAAVPATAKSCSKIRATATRPRVKFCCSPAPPGHGHQQLQTPAPLSPRIGAQIDAGEIEQIGLDREGCRSTAPQGVEVGTAIVTGSNEFTRISDRAVMASTIAG